MKGSFSRKAVSCLLSVTLSVMAIPSVAMAAPSEAANRSGQAVDESQGSSASAQAGTGADRGAGTQSGTSQDAGIQDADQPLSATDSNVTGSDAQESARAEASVQASADARVQLADSEASVQLQSENPPHGGQPIYTVDDFLRIKDGGVNSYDLMADLDFSDYAGTAPWVVPGTFTARLYGNGHTIANLDGYSLFENCVAARFDGIAFEHMSNPARTNAVSKTDGSSFSTILVTKSNDTLFRDLKFTDAQIHGTRYCGVVTGLDTKSTFQKITIEDSALTCTYNGIDYGNCTGLLAGRLSSSDLADIDVSGEVVSYGINNGGVIGEMSSGSICNMIAQVSMDLGGISSSSAEHAVLIGDIVNGSPRLSDCIVSGAIDRRGNALGKAYAISAEAESSGLLAYMNDVLVEDTLMQAADGLFAKGATAVPSKSERFRTFNRASDIEANAQTARGFYRGLGFSGDIWSYDAISFLTLRHFSDIPLDVRAKVDFSAEHIAFSGEDAAELEVVHDDQTTEPLTNPFDISELLDDPTWNRALTVGCFYEEGGSSYAAEYTIKVPKRAETPAIVSVTHPSSAGTQGAIEFRDQGTYEYHKVGDAEGNWSILHVYADLTQALDPGVYQIRVPVNDGYAFASRVATVAIRPFGITEGQAYRVELIENGGMIPANVTEYAWGIGAELPTPSRYQHTFMGWFSDPDFAEGTRVERISPIDTGDKRFYAKWLSNLTSVTDVRVYGNVAAWQDGAFRVTIPLRPESTAQLERNTVVKLADGASYAWSMLSDWNPAVETMAHAKLIVTAADGIAVKEYPLEITIAAGPSDGSGGDDGDDGTGDGSGTKPDPDQPTAPDPAVYSIIYACNGGTIEDAAVSQYTAGTGVQLPRIVKRADYTFMGWYDNPSLSGEPVESIGVTATGNKAFYAKWLSSKTGFVSVKVDGRLGSVHGNGAVVMLPAGSSLPDSLSQFDIVMAPGAVAGPLSTTDGGATWTFECTAADGITKATCTVEVKVAADQSEQNLADVTAASSTIFNTLSHADANHAPDLRSVESQQDLEEWIDGVIASLEADLPEGVTVEREVIRFAVATPGTASNPAGVDGYYKYAITVSKDGAQSEVTAHSEAQTASSVVLDAAAPETRDGAAAEGRLGAGSSSGEEQLALAGTRATAVHPISVYATPRGNGSHALAKSAKPMNEAERFAVIAANIKAMEKEGPAASTADDMLKPENPKTLVLEGTIKATPYQQIGVDAPIGNGTGNSAGAGSESTGNGGGSETNNGTTGTGSSTGASGSITYVSGPNGSIIPVTGNPIAGNPSLPATGDEAPLSMAAGAFAIAGIVLIAMALMHRKQRAF